MTYNLITLKNGKTYRSLSCIVFEGANFVFVNAEKIEGESRIVTMLVSQLADITLINY